MMRLIPPYVLHLRAYLLHCLCVCLLLPGLLYGQVPELPKKSDVRVVIDISGSMKKNDPHNLRRPALDMLVNLLPEGSRGGVWTFGQYVNMLVKHGAIDDNWKQQAAAQTQAINSVAQFTNIGEALEKTAYDKAYTDKGDFQTHVILLTDGMVDIDRDPAKNVQERKRILDDIVPLYQQAGYKIHTISLSDNADKQLMDRLAVATDGQSAVANTAEDLMGVFLQVFDRAVPKEELPLTGNTFLTDSSIEEFTALIFRQTNSPATQLIAPDLAKYTQATVDPNVNWYATDHYDLVTVKRPLEGEWRIVAELDPKSRITVVSDLRLVVKPLSGNIQVNQAVDLSLVLREDNNVVTRAEFLNLLDIDVKVTHIDSGQHQSQRLSEGLVPGNGVYAARLDYFKNPGDYEIRVNVDGKSFQRQFNQRVSVRQPFMIEHDTISADGKTQLQVRVLPQIKRIDFDKTEVVGKLKDPSGSSNIVRFTLTDGQIWQWQMTPELEGQYHLSVRVTALDSQGQSKHFIPEPVVFSFPEEEDFFTSLNTTEDAGPLLAEVDEDNTSALVASITSDEIVEEQINEAELIAAEEAAAETEKNHRQWLLYGVLGAVNILIILVIYLLYRKLFGRSAALGDEEEKSDVETAGKAAASDAGFEEPPMDEMNVSDLGEAESEIDLADDDSETQDLDTAAQEQDPLAELSPEALDDDEDPEFSLDDFAPDSLDDDEDT
ncbi:MAG: VWA domain-containing protein [Cellvibrionaceae bacterium]|nr:VWA domain-containing protein [Cellvibrionaceae bacterium]